MRQKNPGSLCFARVAGTRKALPPNPAACREGRGIRLFCCSHYDGCLDKAAKGMWTGFTCSKCLVYAAAVRSRDA